MGLRITPGLTFVSAILVFALLYDPPRYSVDCCLALPTELLYTRGESEGKTEQAQAGRTSYLEDLKYIATVKSFLLNAIGQ